MAEWAARKNKKSCDQCAKLADPKAFAKGSRVRIAWVYDCKNCEVRKSRPIKENENVIDLYNALPSRFDFHGIRVVTAVDIKFVLEVFEVPKELWHDHYYRIVFLHNTLIEAHMKEEERERKRKESDSAWKDRDLPSSGRSRRLH